MSGSRRSSSRLAHATLVAALTLLLLVSTALTPTASAADQPAPADPTPAAQPWQRKVQADVLGTLEAGRRTDLFVRFSGRADLSRASTIADWDERGRYVVDQLRRAADDAQRDARAVLDSAGATYQSFWISNAIVVQGGSADLAARLAAVPAVAQLRAVPTYEAPELTRTAATRAAAAVEWGIANIRADRVWSDLDVRGEGIVIGSIDTGVQFDHPALKAAYRGTKADGTVDHDYSWFDPSGVCPAAEPCDNIFHGTHTTGTMVGGDGPGGGIGVAPAARWIAAKGCEDEERGCSVSALLASGQWMLAPTDLTGRNARPDLRPQIVNNSWGESNGSVENPFYDEVVAAWNAAGIFAVFSNGNSGTLGCDTSGSPADGKDAYAVGAYDASNAIAPFSSRGPGGPGDLKPDLAAPGVAVRSAIPGNTYAAANGTSMAAPHVAGTVALMWSAADALVGDVDGTRELLGQTAVDAPDLSCGGTAEVNNVFGEGRLDAYAATAAAPVGDTGTLAGRVTATTGEPIAGATVTGSTAGYQRSTRTDADGRFELRVVAGTYQLAASAYGYRTGTVDGLVVTKDGTTTRDVPLTSLPMATITGNVTDGSGHGWPLYASVTIAGTPLAPVHTDPTDGSYRVRLPVDTTYRVTVDPQYPGYETTVADVAVGTGDRTADHRVPVVAGSCTAAGYRTERAGLYEPFDATTAPAGWTAVTAIGDGWEYDDPGKRGNLTGGRGGFAAIDSAEGALREDSWLVSPVTDLSGIAAPVVDFRSDLLGSRAAAEVELSTDGGATWTNIWRRNGSLRGPQQVRVEIPAAAGQNDARVRFRYHNTIAGNGWWQLDDVLLGATTCAPVAGGLVVGNVRDDRAGAAVNHATVRNVDRPAERSVAAETPEDPALDDGFYWMFSPPGPQRLTAGYDYGQYEARTGTVDVPADGAVRADFALGMGELAVTASATGTSVQLGQRAEVSLTLKNVGTGRLSYNLAELTARAGDPPPGTAGTAGTAAVPLRRFANTDDGGPLRPVPAATAGSAPRGAGPWVRYPNLPSENLDALAAVHDGKLYSFGGWYGMSVNKQVHYVHDPATKAWAETTRSTIPRAKTAGGFVGDKLYAVGGWAQLGSETATTQIYDPATDTWSTGADAPVATAAAGSAVLDGRLYIVGGRTPADPLRGNRTVHAYDPASDSWTRVADFPESVSWTHCGTIGDRIYCAGGQDGGDRPARSVYSYDPGANQWLRVADLPRTVWGAAVTAANGRLLLSGGIVGGYRSNEGFAYDPVTDAWTALPNSEFALYRTAGACGFAKVAGSEGQLGNQPYVEQLPGWDRCEPGGRDAGWLSADSTAGSLAPGESHRITLTLDATLATTKQPGTFSTRLLVHEDTPFRNAALTLTMTATPPPSWGQVTGTVTGEAACGRPAGPLAGARVRIANRHAPVDLTTDADGNYAYWFAPADQPRTATASHPGWVGDWTRIRLRPGHPVRADLELAKDGTC